MNPKPIITVAALCEKVLQEKDGVLSLIRVFDRFLVPEASATQAPGQPLALLQGMLVVCLRSGDFKGSLDVGVRIRQPTDEILTFTETFPSLFNGGDHGVNLIVQVLMPVAHRGLHWFEVLAQGEVIGRTPFTVGDAAPAS